MCGISGVFSYKKIDGGDIGIIKKMNDIQKHRGPDDEGIFSNEYCVLGHRRLAIIDLSSNGRQPFFSDDKRYVLAYNGEIFNYIELREELKARGWHFRTQTDTEVLLKAYQQYGVDCLNKLNGMFAFIVYDSKENILFIARDRMGIKPLYYTFIGSKIYFASEIKAFKAIPELKLTLNNQAVFDYLVFNRTNIFTETFTEEIKRVPKGHYGFYNQNGLTFKKWWDPEELAKQPVEDPVEVIARKLEEIMVSAVSLRMRSDVPVGSCLSGGLDSSIILGILYRHNLVNNNYATFSASFPGERIDESKYVGVLQKKYGCLNYQTFPSSQNAFAEIKEFVYRHDEPVINPSFYTQYEVMKLARQNKVTVLLDGQGADEVFAGYHYLHGFNLAGLWKTRRIFDFAGEAINILLRRQDISAFQTFVFQLLSDENRKKVLSRSSGYIAREFFDAGVKSSLIYHKFFAADDLNKSLVRHFQYKLEHLLHSEDRNSMAFSLEARVPYLDYRLVEYMLKVKPDFKIKRAETKFIEKRALGDYTIEEILKRKDKIGFDTPLNRWMGNKQWEDLYRESFGYLSKKFPFIFAGGAKDMHSSIARWKIIQLALWAQIFMDNQGA